MACKVNDLITELTRLADLMGNIPVKFVYEGTTREFNFEGAGLSADDENIFIDLSEEV